MRNGRIKKVKGVREFHMKSQIECFERDRLRRSKGLDNVICKTLLFGLETWNLAERLFIRWKRQLRSNFTKDERQCVREKGRMSELDKEMVDRKKWRRHQVLSERTKYFCMHKLLSEKEWKIKRSIKLSNFKNTCRCYTISSP